MPFIRLAEAVDEALAANHLKPRKSTGLVPHQANQRIIDGTAKKLNMPSERVVMTIADHANTSAASIPLALRHHQGWGVSKLGNWFSWMPWVAVLLGVLRSYGGNAAHVIIHSLWVN